MRSFRVRGLWHLPDAQEGPVAGQLTFKPGVGLRLSLTGVLAQPDSIMHSTKPEPTILGVVEQNSMGGRFVTLSQSSRTRVSFSSPGFATEELHPTTAIFADRHVLEPLFGGCRVRFDYIDEWARSGRNFAISWGEEVQNFRMQSQPSFAAVISGDDLLLSYEIAQNVKRNRFLAREVAALGLKTSEPRSASTFIGAFVRPLHELMILCCDRAVEIQSMHLLIPESEESEASEYASFVFSSTLAPRERSAGKEPELLFTIDDLADGFERAIQEWFAFRESHQAFCGAFFGLLSAPARFLEIRFTWLIRCVRLLASSGVPSDKFIGSPDAIEWLLTEVRPLQQQLLGVSPSEFVRAVTAAQSAIDCGDSFSNVTVHWLAESLKWMLKAFILLRLSPLRSHAAPLLTRNPHVDYARLQVANELRGE
jgi:ApeA-like protein